MNYSIGLMVIIIMYAWLNEACTLNQIEVFNNLPPGKILKVHCRSKNPDADLRVVELKNATVPRRFFFEEGIVYYKRREIFCLLSYQDTFENYQDIRVYRAAARYRCGQLRRWIAKKDGLYSTRSNNTPPGFVLPWLVRLPNKS
ncbi:Plant self-incompatibility S1 [Arabidopsis thaliana x Arabidopsis arenosa]|uniref:Plant self-incompatibility S1 n=1 Tax=Arabidopsis thaliana x Arabidopsis arenosa TaxID=1240361 RepID=A0A8T2AYJ8_9BRAS|nr:Plant self-incompatibility S1 [Arabidopsis thaliana x Arabidopsis arenosa]